ncbi:MAG: CBS domain-containing protein [Candidatus Bathyarchaeota archaeon]|nr:CBS domain-containing protein [Candidatus Bathyarchaeota archaeon]
MALRPNGTELCVEVFVLLIRHLMIKDIVTAKKEETIKDSVALMFKMHVGSIVIVDEKKSCNGLVSERDILRFIAQGLSLDLPLEEVMTKNVITIPEYATFEDAKRIFRERKIRHLPVVDTENRLVGLLSIRQLFDDFFDM